MANHLNLFKAPIPIDYTNISEQTLQKIAESLLTNYVIVISGSRKEFRICEVEFYVNNESHNDTYTHGDPHQKTFGKWYFHRFPNGSYKSGTYKGLDLTLGNNDTFFGVLIRSICDIETGEVIDGPCKTVNKILELDGDNCDDVKTYMENRRCPLNARTTGNFHIKRKRLPTEIMWKGPRIGLSDKYPEWQNVHYRFLIKKDKIKKNKKDLVQIN